MFVEKILILVLTIFSFSITNIRAKVFSQCELAQELEKQGFKTDLLPDWVCLVESESSGNTSAVGGPNKNGSYDHGLFQINDKYWCENGQRGKDCNVKCEDLRNDDITDASNCAKIVYARHGFFAWNGWKAKCQNKTLPDLDHCNL